MLKTALATALFCLPALAATPAATPITTAAPQIFAPGIISGPANDGAPTFTPDGNTLYFARSGSNWGFILESHKVAGQWTQPTVASFSGQFSDSQPALSPDGQHLIFVSTRTFAPNEPTTLGHVASLWQVDRVGDHWSAPTRLPSTINFTPLIFKPTLAADMSLFFMARPAGTKTWRLFHSAYSNGAYATPEPLSFSDGNHTDVDPWIAPDQSFLVFSSAGRATPDDTHEHLYIAFHKANTWSDPIPLRYEGDYEKNPTDDGEANVAPDHRTLFFTSGRTVPVHANRTAAQAAEDFARLNQWDNSNSNVWSISLAPWLDTAKL